MVRTGIVSRSGTAGVDASSAPAGDDSRAMPTQRIATNSPTLARNNFMIAKLT